MGKTEGAAVVEIVSEIQRQWKQPFYIAPEKLDQVTFSDATMVSELTDRINALCEEKDRKADGCFCQWSAHYKRLFEGKRNRTKPASDDVTEKGITAGICEGKDSQNLAAGIIMHWSTHEGESGNDRGGAEAYLLISIRFSSSRTVNNINDKTQTPTDHIWYGFCKEIRDPFHVESVWQNGSAVQR